MLSFLLFINTNKQTFFKGHTLFEKENPYPGLFRSIFLSHHFFCKSFLINELHNCQIRVNAFRSALLILYSSSFLNIMNKMTHQFKHSVIWFPFFPNDIFWLCYHIWKLVGQSKFRICISWVFFFAGPAGLLWNFAKFLALDLIVLPATLIPVQCWTTLSIKNTLLSLFL